MLPTWTATIRNCISESVAAGSANAGNPSGAMLFTMARAAESVRLAEQTRISYSMTRRVRFGAIEKTSSEYQLPSGQLWWNLRYCDEDKVSEMLFTFDGSSEQTWFFANQKAKIHLQELGLGDTSHYKVTLHDYR